MDVPQPTVSQLRAALELAWAVARVRSQARPPLPIPSRLRPLMRVAKLPDRMLATVRSVLEDDPEFRAEVADVAADDQIARIPWLWLHRSDGWEAELAGLLEQAGRDEAELAQKKDAVLAQQRLLQLEVDLARTEADLAVLKKANTQLEALAEAERQARRQAEESLRQRDSALDTSRSTAARLSERIAELEQQLTATVSELRRAEIAVATAGETHDAAQATADGLARQLETATTETARAAADTARTRSDVGNAIARAAAAAHDLGAALSEATKALVGSPTPDRSSDAVEKTPAVAGDPAAVRERAGSGPAPTRPRREPVALPPAVFDDSPEAAEHLIRAPGILLIVDGYNVTLSAWPGLTLPEQRRRLVDALAELVGRVGLPVELFFDGIEDGGRLHPPAAARSKMRVEFSPSSLEADELILSLVDRLDALQPVVVATDDRRVRDEVRRRGANVLSVQQLLGTLGRLRAVTPP